MNRHRNDPHATPDHEQRGEGPLRREQLRLVHARVLDRQDQLLTLATDEGEIRSAVKAESCLLLPEQGDLALLSLAPSGGRNHVLAVLERPGQGARRYELGTETSLQSQDGGLEVSARTLRLESRAETSLEAGKLSIGAADGEARFLRFSFAARQAQVMAASARVLLKRLDQRVERAMSRLGDCYRRIQGMEHVIAGHATWLVRGRLTQKAKNASLDAEENVSINAEHIDLG